MKPPPYALDEKGNPAPPPKYKEHPPNYNKGSKQSEPSVQQVAFHVQIEQVQLGVSPDQCTDIAEPSNTNHTTLGDKDEQAEEVHTTTTAFHDTSVTSENTNDVDDDAVATVTVENEVTNDGLGYDSPVCELEGHDKTAINQAVEVSPKESRL